MGRISWLIRPDKMDEEEAPSPNCFAVTLRLTVFFAVGSERKGFCEEVSKRRVLEGVNAKVTGNKNQKAIARSFILKRTPNGAGGPARNGFSAGQSQPGKLGSYSQQPGKKATAWTCASQGSMILSAEGRKISSNAFFAAISRLVRLYLG